MRSEKQLQHLVFISSSSGDSGILSIIIAAKGDLHELEKHLSLSETAEATAPIHHCLLLPGQHRSRATLSTSVGTS